MWEPVCLPAHTQGTISLKPSNDMNHKMKPTQKHGHCSGLTIATKADVQRLVSIQGQAAQMTQTSLHIAPFILC